MKKKIFLITTLGEKGVPKEIQLLPLGKFVTQDSRKLALSLSKADAENIIAEFEAKATDLMIDYEHAAHRTEPGKPVPAAGWIKGLELREDGLYAKVEWTPKAAEHIENKEYRYISPAVAHTDEGEIKGLFDAALVNKPAVDGMQPLSLSAEDNAKEDKMNKALLAMLGLPETATDKDVETAIAALKQAQPGQSGGVSVAILKALNLPEGSTEDAVLASLKGLDESKTSLATLQAEITTLKQAEADRKAETLVEAAIKEGKVTPAMKETALLMAKKDPESYKAYLEKAPVIIQPGSIVPKDNTGQITTLSADEKAICVQLGVTEEQYIKTKKEISDGTHK